jgi:uncharacterized OB-fold protein
MDERSGHQSGGSPLEPGVDERGQLAMHCTQCGSTLDPSSAYCVVCAAEVSGGTEADAAEQSGGSEEQAGAQREDA